MRIYKNSGISVSVADLRYLKLDQTTQQSVINGVPYIVNGLKTPNIYPNSDSSTAIRFLKANGTTPVMIFNTSTSKVGIGITPDEALHITAENSKPYIKTKVGLTVNSYLGGETGNCLWGFNRHPSTGAIDDSTKDVYAFYLQQGIGITFAADTLGNFSSSSLRLRILTNGHIGIGELSPLERLSVKDASSSVGYNLLRIVNSYYNNSNDVGIKFSSAVTGGGSGTYNTGRILSYFNGSTYSVASLILQNPTNENVWTNTLVTVGGRVGIQVLSPTAYLHIKAGTSTAGTAPIKLTAGTDLSVPESGALEFSTNLLKLRADNFGIISDTYKQYFGAGVDASVYYDGTNLIINPKEVGGGFLDVLGVLQTDGYNSADGSAGITTSFVDNDGNTITIKNGLVTAKTAP